MYVYIYGLVYFTLAKFLQVPFLSSPHLHDVCLCQVLSSPAQVFKTRFRKSVMGRTYWNVETQRDDEMFCNQLQNAGRNVFEREQSWVASKVL